MRRDARPAVGGDCELTTTLDAIVPGAVKEGDRSIWQLGAIQVFDGGADGLASTSPNTLFARQGVFIPLASLRGTESFPPIRWENGSVRVSAKADYAVRAAAELACAGEGTDERRVARRRPRASRSSSSRTSSAS